MDLKKVKCQNSDNLYVVYWWREYYKEDIPKENTFDDQRSLGSPTTELWYECRWKKSIRSGHSTTECTRCHHLEKRYSTIHLPIGTYITLEKVQYSINLEVSITIHLTEEKEVGQIGAVNIHDRTWKWQALESVRKQSRVKKFTIHTIK